jgi:hypothetical protein
MGFWLSGTTCSKMRPSGRIMSRLIFSPTHLQEKENGLPFWLSMAIK